MVNTKFQDHVTSGSKRFLKGFGHVWAWWPSLSCDQDHPYKFMSTFQIGFREDV